MYAINVADLLVLQRDAFPLRLILGPLIQGLQPVEVTRQQVGGFAVPLNCDDERGAALIAVIREGYPEREHTVRCYHSKTGTGGWRAV